jgi:membrane protease YdiL (CAAX protease family)
MGGGKVSTVEFGQPDLLLCIGFMAWFGMAITSGFGGPERDLTQKDIIQAGAASLGILTVIGGYLKCRGINPFRQFGLLRRSLWSCAGLALGLQLAGYPMVMLAGRLTEIASNGKAHPQNTVEYFLTASEGSDKGAIYLTMLLGCVVAPVAEETIFRGYIYGVLKRYTGVLPAGVISAGLFAALHLSVSSLPALFVLALCFTLAYEATGSLLVNILMHAFFNLSMFLVLLGIAHHPGSP